MPTLQGLPQELLEIIFLESMNISLPRCSLSLGRKLSSRAVTLEFTMRSFFRTVDHKAPYRERMAAGDALLQSSLLSCRFFTWDFFMAYVAKAHDAMINLRGRIWKDASVQVPGVEHFDGIWPFKFTEVAYLGFAQHFLVPEKLLHGPWTDDKASLLYVLVSLHGEIDWEGTMAGEVAKQGIKEAIREGSERAVAALTVLLGVAKAIDTDMLISAVLDCHCDINLLRHILFNAQINRPLSSATLDFFHPKLWAAADANGAKGQVLKHMLKKADTFDLDFYFDDTHWSKLVPFPYGGSKFDTRGGFDNINRQLLKNLYINYGRKITRKRRRAY